MKLVRPSNRSLIVLVIVTVIFVFRDPILISLGHKWYGLIGNRTPHANADVHGTVETFDFNSSLLGNVQRSVTVYLPYNYNQVFFGHFPTLYLLHGFAGVKEDWIINAKIIDVVEKLIAEGKLPPLILVMPDGNGPLVKDSEYLDGTIVNQPMEKHIVEEVVPLIDGKYRTIAEAPGRALAGISTGAYGAVNIMLHHPDVFHTAISLGGYFLNREWSTGKLLDSDQEARKRNEPLKYIEGYTTEEKLHIFLSTAENDYKEFIADNNDFAGKLDAAGIDHVLIHVPGGHFWGPWNRAMPEALTWFGDKLREDI